MTHYRAHRFVNRLWCTACGKNIQAGTIREHSDVVHPNRFKGKVKVISILK